MALTLTPESTSRFKLLPDLISRSEIAEALGCSVSAVYGNKALKGLVPSFDWTGPRRPGRPTPLLSKSEVLSALGESTNESKDPAAGGGE